MKKKIFLVLDVEGAGTIEDALVYDIGGVVTDRDGIIYEGFSFLVSEIFDDKEKMDTAYYKVKLPMYVGKDIKKVKHYVAREHIKRLLNKYNIKEVFAYNMYYDRRALNNTIKYVTDAKYKYFLPWGITVSCIWHMVCQVICTQKRYRDFCIANGHISPKGNYRTSAEIVYSYLIKNTFEEEHTGYEDAKIETIILAECFRKHKKMKRNINGFCWKIPQMKKKVNA